MKSDRFEIKKLTFLNEYGFYATFLALLRGCFCVYISVFLLSCASPPKQTYLNNASLSGISKVKVLVSANSPTVTRSRDSSHTTILDALFPLPAIAVRSGIDNESGARIKEHMDLDRLKENIARSFMQPLTNVTCFEAMDYVNDNEQEKFRASTVKYDAVIRLSVREISIQNFAGDNVKIHALVHGQMENLLSGGNVIWDREEYVSSSEPTPISFFEEHGLEELDGMLGKAARHLANDFIYRK